MLTLVLDFASETFARVAMFMVRDDVAIGMAQRGLPPTGGPDDARMRTIELGPDAMPELFEAVLAGRAALRAAIHSPRDRALAMQLGAAAPREAYAAPIESGGHVVALVYADNLPDDKKPLRGPDCVRDRVPRSGPRARSRAARARARRACVEESPPPRRGALRP